MDRLKQLRAEHSCPDCSGSLVEGFVNPDGSGRGNWSWDPGEPAQCCGYAIGVHTLGGPCPTEIEAYQRWGVM